MYSTDEAIIAAVREPVNEPCDDSDADMIAMCSQMPVYLKGQTDTYKHFLYVNSLQQLAIYKQFNSKQQVHVTNFSM